jgi:transposase
VRVRDLPIAGRVTRLVRRKRRYRCVDCRRTFSETDEQLPSRQRVTGRFRARLGERVVGGAAHAEVAREERTSRYQVARASADSADEREAAGCRPRAGAAVARRGTPPARWRAGHGRL